jgi:predicted nucleic acid-binding protein
MVKKSWKKYGKMDKVIIDTSAWIEAFRPQGNKTVQDTVKKLLQNAVILMPGIIRAELLRGTRNKKEFKQLSSLLNGLEYLPVDDLFWEKVAHFSFDLFRAGVTVPLTDTYIALLTMENQAKVVHCNQHFDLIAQKSPLDIYYWIRIADQSLRPQGK